MHKEQDLIRVNYRRSFIVGCLFLPALQALHKVKLRVMSRMPWEIHWLV